MNNMAETVQQKESLNLYQKLAKVRKTVEVLTKDKSGYGYKYVGDDEILARITGVMDKFGVSLIPSVVPATTHVTPYTYSENKQDKAGNVFQKITNEILVQCDTQFVWINNDNPDEKVVVPWTMVGQQSDASQAFGSGMTYCRRYFLLHYFNISTINDDPDNWRSKQREAAASEEREVAKQIIEQVNNVVQAHLVKVPADREMILTIVKKYARDKGKPSNNYYTINDPEVAAKLLQELNATIKD